jgi:peptidase E
MKLFLASRASNSNTLAKLESIVGSFKNKKIAYIPTASNGENDWGYWKIKGDGTWKIVNTLGAKVKAVELENYRNDSVMKELENQDIIWFAGGAAGYLMYWVIRTGLDKRLPEILKRSVYVGSSAGSMVTGPNLEICDWYIGENERGASNIPSLKLVDFDIYPHYEESLYAKIKENYKGDKLYLLKDGEEIIVENDKVTVNGEERIILNT